MQAQEASAPSVIVSVLHRLLHHFSGIATIAVLTTKIWQLFCRLLVAASMDLDDAELVRRGAKDQLSGKLHARILP